MKKIFTIIICFGIMRTTFGQNTAEEEKRFQTVLEKTVDSKKVFGTSFAFKKDTLIWQGASGNLTMDQPYFIASTTKLFTTAIILKLKAEYKLSLDDKISKYIDKSILMGLHFYKGKDYSEEAAKCYYALEQIKFPIYELKFVALCCENIIKEYTKRILAKT